MASAPARKVPCEKKWHTLLKIRKYYLAPNFVGGNKRISPHKKIVLYCTYFQAEPLTDAELARLAPNISSMTMRNIAVQRLGFTEDQVETLVDECRENKEGFVGKVLIRWRNRNISSGREVRICVFTYGIFSERGTEFPPVQLNLKYLNTGRARLIRKWLIQSVDTGQVSQTVFSIIHIFLVPWVLWISPMATGVTINH